MYISSQALGSSGGVKRPGPKTPSFPLDSDSLEPLDEVSRDFLDQLTMWKLEDQLGQQKEQEPQTEPGDLFDTKTLHEKLQQKHFKFMSQHENVKQRLRASKVMSWYWRLKFEEEKSKRGGSNEWNKALQEQLEHMEQLYLREKHVADMWRHRHANTKSREDMARDVKLERWVVFCFCFVCSRLPPLTCATQQMRRLARGSHGNLSTGQPRPLYVAKPVASGITYLSIEKNT